jgi:uncharacterized protein (DUF924 family)
MTATPGDILGFWFGEDLESPGAVAARVSLWFDSDQATDDLVRERFDGLPPIAERGELDSWLCEARTTLALVLVLDQFPRNLYRGTAQSFAFDSAAHKVAMTALERGFDAELRPLEAVFLYLPFEHTEDLESQELSVSLFRGLVDRVPPEVRRRFESFYAYAVKHRDVIERFGRFPHRNGILGRQSTSEETTFLESGGESFGAARTDR